MMRTPARVVSLIFHPLLFPTYGTIIILLSNPHLFASTARKAQILWVLVVFILTMVFPVLWLGMMKSLKMVESFSLETAKERIIPYIATATFYMWTYRLFNPNVNNLMFSNSLVSLMLLGASLSIFLGFFINIFSKISLHTIAAGNLLGLILTLVRISMYDMRFAFVGAVLLAGIIGSARMYLQAHTKREVFMGYFVGFTGQFIAFNIIPKFF